MLILERILSKDSRIQERHIDFLIDMYRESEIKRMYTKRMEIDPTWLQDIGRQVAVQVSSADDPAVLCTSRSFSKIVIPEVIALDEDRGVYRISSSSKLRSYFNISANTLWELPETHISAREAYAMRIGNSIYVNDLVEELGAVLILQHPMDAPFYDNAYKTSLVVGTSYTVESGNITSNAVTYYTGNTFTAAVTTFTGTGKVKLTNPQRAMEVTDPYPFTIGQSQIAALRMFTEHFKIEERQIAEVRNNMGNDLAVLAPAQ